MEKCLIRRRNLTVPMVGYNSTFTPEFLAVQEFAPRLSRQAQAGQTHVFLALYRHALRGSPIRLIPYQPLVSWPNPIDQGNNLCCKIC